MEKNNGGVKVAARVPGDGKLKVIENAPGTYVSLRLSAEKPKKARSAK
jgi:poly(3-hydroxyalkanoate) synthetase